MNRKIRFGKEDRQREEQVIEKKQTGRIKYEGNDSKRQEQQGSKKIKEQVAGVMKSKEAAEVEGWDGVVKIGTVKIEIVKICLVNWGKRLKIHFR